MSIRRRWLGRFKLCYVFGILDIKDVNVLPVYFDDFVTDICIFNANVFVCCLNIVYNVLSMEFYYLKACFVFLCKIL